MKKIASILKNKEIMNRILFTVLILFIFRIGAQITVPGVKRYKRSPSSPSASLHTSPHKLLCNC